VRGVVIEESGKNVHGSMACRGHLNGFPFDTLQQEDAFDQAATTDKIPILSVCVAFMPTVPSVNSVIYNERTLNES